MWTHIFPPNDSKPHVLRGNKCPCDPELDWEKEIVIHNAWDLRGVQEFVNKEGKTKEGPSEKAASQGD